MKTRQDRFQSALASTSLATELEKSEQEIARLKAELEQLQSQEAGNCQRFPLDRIIPLRLKKGLKQPRKYFDPQAMAKLEDSIRSIGVQEPIVLRQSADGYLETVSGESRWRCSKNVGKSDIPGVVRELSDEQALEVAIISNLMREGLNPVEEADSICSLLGLRLDLDTKEISSLLTHIKNFKQRRQNTDKSGLITSGQLEEIEFIFINFGITLDTFVSNRLPLLKLPDDVLGAILDGSLEFSKAQLIARLDSQEIRAELLKAAITKSLTKAQIRERIQALKPNSKPDHDILNRFKTVYGQAKKSKTMLNDSKKQKKLESLLAQMEKLLAEG